MAKTKAEVKDETVAAEAIPEPRSAERSQVVPVGTMDVDPSTGAPIRVGYPETSDEDEVGEFLLWLQEEADGANEDSMAILAAQLRQAKTAESVAEALREKTTINGADYIGIPFMATGFTIREGKFEDEEIPFYASIEAVSAEHRDGFILNCGGSRILVHLRTLQRLDAFPIALCVTGKTTRKGWTVLSFDVLEQPKA